MKKFNILACFMLFSFFLGCQGSRLKKNFYHQSCPQAAEVIWNKIIQHVAANPILPAKFLRMHFHDCFVRGCDGSILLNSTANNFAEKEAIPNLTLSGFDVIDDIKDAIEKICPKTVSCADILALAARDAVSAQFNKPMWEVLTGRRDGTVSKASEVLANLPGPSFNFTQLEQNFASKGLSVLDLVVLSGAHTIGVGKCNTFSSRLYNFTGKGGQDPSLNSTYAELLKAECKTLEDNTTRVEMDPGSAGKFDSHYYPNLLQKQGLFQSDAALLTQDQSAEIVEELVDEKKFFTYFAQAMKKMGDIGILTGPSGEIRIKCSVIN